MSLRAVTFCDFRETPVSATAFVVFFLLGTLQLAAQPNSNLSDSAQRMLRAKIVRMPSGQEFYPESAKRENRAGTAGIHVCVDAAASITSVDVLVSSGHTILDTAAVSLARQGQYVAAMNDKGMAVPSCVSFMIDFCTSSAIGKLFGGRAQCGSAAYLRAKEDQRLLLVKASAERIAADQVAATLEQRRREEAEERDREAKQEEEARRLEQERLMKEQEARAKRSGGVNIVENCLEKGLKPGTKKFSSCIAGE